MLLATKALSRILGIVIEHAMANTASLHDLGIVDFARSIQNGMIKGEQLENVGKKLSTPIMERLNDKSRLMRKCSVQVVRLG